MTTCLTTRFGCIFRPACSRLPPDKQKGCKGLHKPLRSPYEAKNRSRSKNRIPPVRRQAACRQTKAQLLKAAVSLLAGQGMPEPQARTFIGRAGQRLSRRRHRDESRGGRCCRTASRCPRPATCQRLAGERKSDGGADWTSRRPHERTPLVRHRRPCAGSSPAGPDRRAWSLSRWCPNLWGMTALYVRDDIRAAAGLADAGDLDVWVWTTKGSAAGHRSGRDACPMRGQKPCSCASRKLTARTDIDVGSGWHHGAVGDIPAHHEFRWWRAPSAPPGHAAAAGVVPPTTRKELSVNLIPSGAQFDEYFATIRTRAPSSPASTGRNRSLTVLRAGRREHLDAHRLQQDRRQARPAARRSDHLGRRTATAKPPSWSNIMLNVMQAGQKVCLASLEMKPRDSLAKMTQQASGVGNPSIPDIRASRAGPMSFCGFTTTWAGCHLPARWRWPPMCARNCRSTICDRQPDEARRRRDDYTAQKTLWTTLHHRARHRFGHSPCLPHAQG